LAWRVLGAIWTEDEKEKTLKKKTGSGKNR
jgi:hypothetical protein